MNERVYRRFWAKVDCAAAVPKGFTEPCWLWMASCSAGYGRFGNWDDRSRTQLAHRLAYEMIVGPISDGLTIDHSCLNTKCVNPAHFEVVQAGVNAIRGAGPAALNARKTHCHMGHPLSGDNLYLHNARRNCKTCRRRAFNEFKARQADS